MIFILSWIFIHQVTCRYPWKACLFAFRLMPYLFGLFHWGACRVSKLGLCQKGKVAKLIGMYGKGMLCQVLGFPFVNARVPTAHSLRWNPLIILENFGAVNLLTLHAPSETILQIRHHRKANKHAFQGYLTWWIKIQDKRNIIDQSRVALLTFFEGCIMRVMVIIIWLISRS